MQHTLPGPDRALHLIYHVVRLVLKSDRQFRLCECNSGIDFNL